MKLIAERKIDELGRIVLPVEIRNRLHITEKSSIDIYEDEDNIVLRKAEPCCRMCGSTGSVNNDLRLCNDCIAKVKKY